MREYTTQRAHLRYDQTNKRSAGLAATAVLGPVGLIGGVVAGAAFAVTFCGLLAIAMRIRDLLEECLGELRGRRAGGIGRE